MQGQKEVSNKILWPFNSSFSAVYFHKSGAGMQGRYPPEKGFNLHTPKGCILILGSLSRSVAMLYFLYRKNFDLLP